MTYSEIFIWVYLVSATFCVVIFMVKAIIDRDDVSLGAVCNAAAAASLPVVNTIVMCMVLLLLGADVWEFSYKAVTRKGKTRD